LGNRDNFDPISHGFDQFFGFRGGMSNYFPKDQLKHHEDAHFGSDSYYDDDIMRNREVIREPEYLTDALAREALAFIGRHTHQPYFIYLAFSAVHNPLQASGKYLDRFANTMNVRRRTYAAMLSAMDDAVGAILRTLRDLNQIDNTLIVFLSDNGGGGNRTSPHSANTGRNAPFRGFKFDVYEGGIRVPFIIQWNGHFPSGLVYNEPVSSLDIFPTIMAATGAGLPQDRVIDGVDLLPFVNSTKIGVPHQTLYWRWTFRGGESAVRKGNWKLVMLNNKPPQLYDVAADVSEQHDLAPEYPDVVAGLHAEWKTWSNQMAEPRW
jgi:arylsulfatase A-like enzyme